MHYLKVPHPNRFGQMPGRVILEGRNLGQARSSAGCSQARLTCSGTQQARLPRASPKPASRNHPAAPSELQSPHWEQSSMWHLLLRGSHSVLAGNPSSWWLPISPPSRAGLGAPSRVETTWGKLCPGWRWSRGGARPGKAAQPLSGPLLHVSSPRGWNPWARSQGTLELGTGPSLPAAVRGEAPTWALGWDLSFSCL